MHRIAIIQFPGLNTEYETRREIGLAGMRGEFFRWNEPGERLARYDGYVIGGGFSYEDRGRAGVIAAHDPLMKIIKEQAENGKPVLGICNGAQILVESGLIPGADGNRLAMALAKNRRVKDGKILGTGYYNAWVNLKCTAPSACMFMKNFKPGEIIRAPVAHAEGRFLSLHAGLMEQLLNKNQLVLRYTDQHGVITQDFPANPNSASFNTAAMCNPAGNIMAVMPHLERDQGPNGASQKLFTSLRDSLSDPSKNAKKRSHHITVERLIPAFGTYTGNFSMEVSLMITDNEAETHEMALTRLGFPKVGIKRKTHYEIGVKGRIDFQKLGKRLIQSGVLMNTNKESASVIIPKQKRTMAQTPENFVFQLLVRETDDFMGQSKYAILKDRLKFTEITGIKTGTLWEIKIPTKSAKVAQSEFEKIIATNLFANPHRQHMLLM